MQPCVCLSLHVSVDVVVVGFEFDVPSSHHDISDCHSVEDLCPSDHVTTGWNHVTVGAAGAVGSENLDTGIGSAFRIPQDPEALHQWVKLEPHWLNLMYL